MPNRLSKEKYQLLKDEFRKGMSLSKIGQKYNIDRGTLSKRMRAEGFVFVQNNTQFKYNEEFFKVIDNEAKAYFLGLMLADGCTRDGKAEITLKDKKILEVFRDHVVPGKPIHTKIVKGNTYYRLAFSNKQFVKHLIAAGCVPAKSLTLEFPSKRIVPLRLMRHFLRGYVDGDGCIYFTPEGRPQLSVMGTESFLRGMSSECDNHCQIASRKYKLQQRKNTKAFMWRVSRKSWVNVILKWLYKDAEIYLERKQVKACRAFQ